MSNLLSSLCANLYRSVLNVNMDARCRLFIGCLVSRGLPLQNTVNSEDYYFRSSQRNQTNQASADQSALQLVVKETSPVSSHRPSIASIKQQLQPKERGECGSAQ